VTTVQAGTVSAPAITTTGDTNTGIFFPAADTIAFSEGGVEAMRINSSGQLDLVNNPILTGGTANGVTYLNGSKVLTSGSALTFDGTVLTNETGSGVFASRDNATFRAYAGSTNSTVVDINSAGTGGITKFSINNTERARIDSSGNLLVGTTSSSPGTDNVTGVALGNSGYISLTRDAGPSAQFNRKTNDGTIVEFAQAGTTEGAISVSGTTVTYGGGHLARFGQLPDGSEDPTLLKGTVLTNLDEMCVWINKETGIPADNEQCNKVKISDVDGDANVAGVFVSWSYDEQHETNDLFVAMTGDMIIRIAQGVTIQRGDLLMSAGDGTAKPQGDDIVRSKTVAKVTSTHVTCTYADGSYCVPCVLMAC
jgi:hypothetical protein